MPRTKQFDREEVLQRAMNLFWEKGFHATSMQDLVNHLKINRASIYDTYGGKKELFDEAFSLYRKQNAEFATKFFAEHDSVKDGLREFFVKIVEQSIADVHCKGCFSVNVATEFLPGDDEMQMVLNLNKVNFEASLVQFIQKGVDSGEINSDKNIHAIAAFLFTLFGGVQVTAKMSSDKESLLAIIETGLKVLE